jgi:hypothetical protein
VSDWIIRGEDMMQFINLSKKIFGAKTFWLLFFLIVINLVLLNQSALVLKDTTLTDTAGDRTKIVLPFKQEMAITEYVISGKIYYHGFLSANTVHIIPDDEVLSIRVNNHDVPLTDVNPAALGDYVQGFHFNLGCYLQKGNNDIEIRIRNNSGPSGLFFQNSLRDIKTLIENWLLLILISAILYLILSCFISNKVFIFILLGGFLIRMLYFWVTPYYIREYDVLFPLRLGIIILN